MSLRFSSAFRTLNRVSFLNQIVPRRFTSSLSTETAKPWTQPMPEEQFQFMRNILAAPSPIGHEAAMTHGVILPEFQKFMPKGWKVHTFKGHGGLVIDTHPDRQDLLKVMVVGHADKIRMQVRSIGDDGKVWIDSDSFIPLSLLGNEVILFSEDPAKPGTYRRFEGGTVEALGAIHFAEANVRSGEKGVKKEQLYLELHVHGENKKTQIENLGIRPGDSIIFNRPIKKGFMPNTFTGSYLDNGLGCFVTAEVARLVACKKGPLDNVRCLFAFATYEEIGRFGSRVFASLLKPDALIAVDVNHDYVAAPGVGDKRFSPLAMGKGFTVSHGSITSFYLNGIIEKVASKAGIPYQRDVVGVDTGTDAMAAVLGGVDAASTSIGFPIRNMHTISEAGHTGDVLASVHAIYHTINELNEMNEGKGAKISDFTDGHSRLDQAQLVKQH